MASALLACAGCGTLPVAPPPRDAVTPTAAACDPGTGCGDAGLADADPRLAIAQRAAHQAMRSGHHRAARRAWLQCATTAHAAMREPRATAHAQAAALATRCTDGLLASALQSGSLTARDGLLRTGDIALRVDARDLSPQLRSPMRMLRAADVPMDLYGGQRHARAGFGVPLALMSARCDDAPACALQPPEGVFRSATAWLESDPGDADGAPRLVLVDPLRTDALALAGHRYPLAADTSAFYAWGVRGSPLRRLGVWGLLGGDEVGRRAGLYLLEDYDPDRRPIVMIHGLGSHPLTWARLSNAIWGDPALRARFQVWHVVHRTDAPLLIARRRVQDYLDHAWAVLDPGGDDRARTGLVLVGHSMGGVVARMLCVDSGDVLWNAAFAVPPDALCGDASDLATVTETFRFTAYPGVTRAIFMAAPHHGSPAADRWIGRLFRAIVGRRVPEMQALRRVARTQPSAVHEALRAHYVDADLNSIATLQTAQPVRRAGETLLPVPAIAYHTIAGRLPGRVPAGDGVVPLDSAVLPGAASTYIVDAGHAVYDDPDAIAEVLRILHADIAR